MEEKASPSLSLIPHISDIFMIPHLSDIFMIPHLSNIFMIPHLSDSRKPLISQIRCKVKTFSTISSINSQKLLLFAANLSFLLTFLQEYAEKWRKIVAIAFGCSKENLYLCQQITEER